MNAPTAHEVNISTLIGLGAAARLPQGAIKRRSTHPLHRWSTNIPTAVPLWQSRFRVNYTQLEKTALMERFLGNIDKRFLKSYSFSTGFLGCFENRRPRRAFPFCGTASSSSLSA